MPKQLPMTDSLCVPGFGLDYDFQLESHERFSHGISDGSYDRMTVREVAMLGLMDSITDKANWKQKVTDDGIVAKWREEALKIQFMSEQAFDWCLRELRADALSDTKLVATLKTASWCIKSDDLIPETLQSQLKKQIQPLLQEPKDWHPNSGDKVLDLVHPSLYPAVYGRTKVLPQGSVELNDFLVTDSSAVLLPAIESLDAFGFSDRFQWLPCDVDFLENEGTKVKIASYINNLRPDRFADLYATIEQVISYSIPAWNEVLLTDGVGKTPLRIKTYGPDFEPRDAPEWIHNLATDEDDDNFEQDLQKVEEYWQTPEPPIQPYIERNSLEDEWESIYPYLSSLAEAKFKRIRKTLHPDPDIQKFDEWSNHAKSMQKGQGPPTYPISLESKFREQGLQVIVKLASIELSPDKPEYDGGNWHLEGTLNEHIAATAIYYFDSKNVSDSRIHFRHEAFLEQEKLEYEQSEHTPLCEIFGTATMYEEPAVQEIGSIATPGGRLLAFPNTLQHKVDPFKLIDPSKNGHRRILVLWLVDPNYRILSTRSVPPQQHDWWATKAKQKLEEKLPKELQEIVYEFMKEDTMTVDEANEYRLELMAERVVLKDSVDSAVETYFLCEH